MIPKTSRFRIEPMPEWIQNKHPSKLVDLIETVKIMANEQSVKTSLEELGYKSLASLKVALRSSGKKEGIDIRVRSQGDNIWIFKKTRLNEIEK